MKNGNFAWACVNNDDRLSCEPMENVRWAFEGVKGMWKWRNDVVSSNERCKRRKTVILHEHASTMVDSQDKWKSVLWNELRFLQKFDHDRDPFWNWVALSANGDELIHLDIMGERTGSMNEWFGAPLTLQSLVFEFELRPLNQMKTGKKISRMVETIKKKDRRPG